MFSYPFSAGGTTLRVLQSGLSGPKVVLVHGTGARADRWVSNIDAIAATNRMVYAIDLPGHGFSEKSGAFDHSVPAYGEVLAAFLDGIGAEKVTLVGTSLGGHVVARYAIDHPERVSGIVLVGSMGLVPIGEETRKRIAGGANNQTLEGIRMKFSRVIFDPALVTPAMVEEEFRINNSPGAAESFRRLGDYISTRLDDDVVGEELRELAKRIPVLLVWGSEDPVVPIGVGRAAADIIGTANFLTIPGAAHTAYFEKPDLFNDALVGFLQTAAPL